MMRSTGGSIATALPKCMQKYSNRSQKYQIMKDKQKTYTKYNIWDKILIHVTNLTNVSGKPKRHNKKE